MWTYRMAQQSVTGRCTARAFQFESGYIEPRMDQGVERVVRYGCLGFDNDPVLNQRGGTAANQRLAGDSIQPAKGAHSR